MRVIDAHDIHAVARKYRFLHILCIDQIALSLDLRDHIVFIRDQSQFFAY